MFDKFADYMQYLLPSAFKKQKNQNQLLIYCRVVGRLYDNLLQSILRLREETIIATCSPEMLEVFGGDYNMPRMRGETDDMYRKRLQMKALVAEAAGTQKGILYALASVGYDNCSITPLYITDPDRWSEIRINIYTQSVDVDNPIAFECIIAEIMKVKKAGTLPHWHFYYPVRILHTDINKMRVAVRFILCMQFWGTCIYNGQNHYDGGLQYDARRNYKLSTVLIIHFRTKIKQGAWSPGIGTRVQIQNDGHIIAAVRNCYSISFWECALYNGTWTYDDVLDYGTKRRYRMHVVITDKNRIYTGQSVKQGYLMIYMQVWDTGHIATGQVNRYRIKGPAEKKKTRICICIEITFPGERIDNIHIETCRNVAYFDGTLRYDGTAKYDALYRKEEVE